MTQIASGRRGHQFTVSGHGPALGIQQQELGRKAYSSVLAPAVPAAAEPGMEAAASEELLAEVWRTSSYLETVQWELDNAHQSLQQALKQAAGSGVDRGALLQAANLTSEELEAALVDAPAPPAFF